MDIEGRFLESNPTFHKMLGYRAEELQGRAFADFTHPDDVGTDMGLFRQMMEAKLDHYQLEKRYIRKDGTLLHARLTMSLVRDAQGEPHFVIGIKEDISQRRGLEDQLRQAQKMEAIGQLAGGVAHDFNNLLNVILGYTELLRMRGDYNNPETRQNLEEVQKAAERAAQLTHQLLAFSRKQVMRPEVVDLNEVVRSVEQMLRRTIGEDIRLVAELDSAVRPVKVDRGQIEQVILNLTLNARDAMPKGGKLTLATANTLFDEDFVRRHKGAKPGRFARLTLTDTGCGMDSETLSHIFEPFFTTKVSGQVTGIRARHTYP